MFISLHVPLNHIWHHWLLSCPGSPDRHPSASVEAILCSLAFRTQQGFVNASLIGAQEHTGKCFKASSTAADSHDTQKYPQEREKLEEFNSLLCFLCPLCPAVALAPLPFCCCCCLEGATKHDCNSRLIVLKNQVRPRKREERSGVAISETVQTVNSWTASGGASKSEQLKGRRMAQEFSPLF